MMGCWRGESIVILLTTLCLWSKPALAWFAVFPLLPATTIPTHVKLLILPGFANASRDYCESSSSSSSSLMQGPSLVSPSHTTTRLSSLSSSPTPAQGSLVWSLRQRGWTADQIHVVPIQRLDWIQVFTRGALDWQFWRGTAPPTRPAFSWYLDRVIASVNEMTATMSTTNAVGDHRCPTVVVLIGHSAGGWLGRAALGYGGISATTTTNTGTIVDKVCGLVTLGAPHVPPPPGNMDMTRGALTWTNANYPGAYPHQSRDSNNNGATSRSSSRTSRLFYLTVSGMAVKGVEQFKASLLEPTSVPGLAYNSYKAVCGDGEVIGDGVVPQCAAHLEGATQLDLPNVFHSINNPDRWYGSDAVIDSWHSTMLRQIGTSQPKNPTTFSLFLNPLENIFR